MKIIKINAIWCSACLITNPRFNEVIKEFPDIEVVEYDYDFDNEEVLKYNVGKTIPVFILEKNDIEISRLIGERTKDEIREFIKDGAR